jgi:energy-coupling factor transporter ATP-binding protein EcfA2
VLRCGIEGLRNARIDRISGREARRAMPALVFATESEMFLLDEPTADPDSTAGHATSRLPRETDEERVAVAGVPRTVDEYAHRIVLMDAGQIIAGLAASGEQKRAAPIFRVPASHDPRVWRLA